MKIDYYVAFGDSKVKHFWDVFTCQGFRHCCAFKWDGFNWILVDPLGQCLDVTIMPYGSEDDVPSIFKKAGWTVVNIIPGGEQNALLRLLRIVILVLTLGLFTYGDGVYVIFEKEEN